MEERVTPGVTNVTNFQKHLARYNLAMDAAAGLDVLDLGCGTGYGTNLLSYYAKSVVGIDYDSSAIGLARLSCAARNNVRIDQHDIRFYSDKYANKFDLIVCFEVVEHIQNFEALKNNIDIMLKPGGHILFSVPLNEPEGFNIYHEHRYTVSKAQSLFNHYQLESNILQKDINFHRIGSIDDSTLFTYFIGYYKKNG